MTYSFLLFGFMIPRRLQTFLETGYQTKHNSCLIIVFHIDINALQLVPAFFKAMVWHFLSVLLATLMNNGNLDASML